MLLSRAIVRLAAEMRTTSALAEIRDRQRHYAEAIAGTDIDAIAAVDLAFHRAISSASGNAFLGKFYQLTLDYGRRVHRLHYYPMFAAAERETCLSEHAALVAAIERRDAEAADTLIGQHVLSELKVMQRSLEPKVGLKFAMNNDWKETR
jgi:DNA-binding GntR family transcriptional regulator